MKTLQQTQQIDTGALKKFAQAARRQLREQTAAQLDGVLKGDSAELREREAAIKELRNQIAMSSREAVIDRVAYTWFNRFCALRFMDVNQYTRMGTVSPTDGFTQPEILAEAKQGHIDESLKGFVNQQRVFDLLSGRITSKAPQQEAYRLLIVAVCNYYNAIMPFLFEKIADYTELLMPDDLLSESSILADMRSTLTADSCQDVEVIGWLYQFYISEKKDEIFEDLKKNKKIIPENIPAATQLFTPHWIVRYLVENSLGRLWMLNKPKSRLIDRMVYYIKSEQVETDFLHISKPEDLKICDPACGSGHMLVYAFDLLHAIYEEEGYEPTEIPRLILENNLYGIEIDERAGELAAFALTMKARHNYRRFFNKPVQPNICVLENIHFQEGELKPYLDAVGTNLFTNNLRETLHQFRECDNFGSLIKPAAADVSTLLQLLESKKISENIFLHQTQEKVLQALRYADYLSPKYHIVIANPPYMGGKGMNPRLKQFAENEYATSKADTFAMFIERGFALAVSNGYNAMVTMQSWMFLPSYEQLRVRLLSEVTIDCMVHMANMVMGIAFGTTATVWHKKYKPMFKGSFSYIYYEDLTDDNEPSEFPMQNGRLATASAIDFKKIPGSPIAYWVSNSLRDLFNHPKIAEICETRLGMATASNERFLRLWHEVSASRFSTSITSRAQAESSGLRWFPYQKGGDYRKWYGNAEFIVNWEKDGDEIKNFVNPETGKVRSHNYNLDYIFREGVTWNALTSYKTSARISTNSLFDNAGSSLFASDSALHRLILAYINSNLIPELISLISPTLNYQPGDIGKLPAFFDIRWKDDLTNNVASLIEMASNDWNSYETSWGFTTLPLLQQQFRKHSLNTTYTQVRQHWHDATARTRALEEENNRILIDGYALGQELTPDVPINEVTLTCNPRYRYGGDKTDQELEELLLADTIKEFISYAVGCMFGRYALEKPGLILANQHQNKEQYLTQIPEPSFLLDADNVIPILDGDWFSDDISDRFRKFLRVTFGDEHYQENLQFIENGIGKDIRKYFLKDFYTDHIKRYKKRPIYWLFSSPKGTFNALIYMHRYRPDTVSVILNDYLREFRNKLSARKSHLESVIVSASVSPSEKTSALKEIETLKKAIAELDTYERDVLYPLATERVQIDLDDGVKVNYSKFGKALKNIPGMASEED